MSKPPEFDMTKIPDEGIVFVRFHEPPSMGQWQQISDGLKKAKDATGSKAVFIMMHGADVSAMSDEDLAKIGLQRIPAAG